MHNNFFFWTKHPRIGILKIETCIASVAYKMNGLGGWYIFCVNNSQTTTKNIKLQSVHGCLYAEERKKKKNPPRNQSNTFMFLNRRPSVCFCVFVPFIWLPSSVWGSWLRDLQELSAKPVLYQLRTTSLQRKTKKCNTSNVSVQENFWGHMIISCWAFHT